MTAAEEQQLRRMATETRRSSTTRTTTNAGISWGLGLNAAVADTMFASVGDIISPLLPIGGALLRSKPFFDFCRREVQAAGNYQLINREEKTQDGQP
jgi:hypothetical protein